ncbi:helix-turn-helix transcriptional regulator [Cupriavidus oxalaticus]|uniref:helix-turn-helix transcriptional regulator n=1 Tax=Cupriavidus oxalaticus TaxID=96344 RepID=UPI001F0E27E7|nr:helix-turn-helix domain-containing protein [Cupriavidus oxalaticus]
MSVNPHPPTRIFDRAGSDAEPPKHPQHACSTSLARRPAVDRASDRLLTTEELATALGMSAQSIRKRYSQTGSYFQLRPVKLPNRRLLWPADAVEQLINR